MIYHNKIFIRIVFIGIVLLICSLLNLSFSISVIFMFTFYRYGEKVFLGASAIFLLYPFISLAGYSIAPSLLYSPFNVDIPSFTTGDIFRILLIDTIMYIVGIYYFLKMSTHTWMQRLCVGGVIIAIGRAQNIELNEAIVLDKLTTEENLPWNLSSGSVDFVSLVTEIFENDRIIYAQIPIFVMLALIVQFLFTTLVLQTLSKFSYKDYCHYLLSKIRNEFRYLNKNYIYILIACILLYVTHNNLDVPWILWLNISALGILLICILIYLILGIACFYHSKRYRITEHAGWYIFWICIILILPVVNIVLVTLLVIWGIKYEWTKRNLDIRREV